VAAARRLWAPIGGAVARASQGLLCGGFAGVRVGAVQFVRASKVAGVVSRHNDVVTTGLAGAIEHDATERMGSSKQIVLIAHDQRKADLVEWARYNRTTLGQHQLFATGTTGALLADELDLPVSRYLSGPLGGDQQVGAAIAEGRIDLVIFFSDPLAAHPHDVDVKALLRIAVVYDIPIACNRASADFMLSSPLMRARYARRPPMAVEP
jgi:methylglyoxal synthase